MLKDLSNLRSLDISRNAIAHLDKSTFGGLLQLEALNISDCASLQVIINLPFGNFRLCSFAVFSLPLFVCLSGNLSQGNLTWRFLACLHWMCLHEKLI